MYRHTVFAAYFFVITHTRKITRHPPITIERNRITRQRGIIANAVQLEVAQSFWVVSAYFFSGTRCSLSNSWSHSVTHAIHESGPAVLCLRHIDPVD